MGKLYLFTRKLLRFEINKLLIAGKKLLSLILIFGTFSFPILATGDGQFIIQTNAQFTPHARQDN